MDQLLILTLLGVPIAGAALTWSMRADTAWHGVGIGTHTAVLAVALLLLDRLLKKGSFGALGGWLYLDHLGGIVLLIVAGVGFAAALYSVGYLRHERRQGALSGGELRRYYALLHLFTFTMLLSTVSGNLGLLWTAIAATTIASAPLVDFYGSAEPLEAAWKYILLTTAGAMVALLGFLVLYQAGTASLGPSYDFSTTTLAQIAPRIPPAAAITAFSLVLVGLGTKAGLAPMHTWLPDAYSQAPSPICALLSGAELNCAMLGILRVFAVTAPAAGADRLRLPLMGLGLLSLAVGVIFLVSQQDFKRLLAYSSIEHMGLITLGLGIGGPLALFGALFQMVNHAFTKSLMFFATGNLLLRFRTRSVPSVTGVVRLMPATAVATMAGALGIAGAPPFGLFSSELSIVVGAVQRHAWLPVLLIPLLLLVAFLAMLAPFNRMVFSRQASSGDVAAGELNPYALVPAYLALIVALILGVWVPEPLRRLLAQAVAGLSP